MRITRSGVRVWATRGFFGLLAAIVLAVLGQWFIQVATDKGYYQHAGQTWDRLVSPFLAALTSWPVIVLLLLSGGFVAGLWVDAYLAQRGVRRWWEGVQAFAIRDASCLLAGVKRNEFEKSDKAMAIANELRGYVNSGHVPLFLEMEYEKPVPDLSDPKARYEPPYDKKNVSLDQIISKRTVEGIARARKWALPWPIPEKDDGVEKPFKRPAPRPLPGALAPTQGLRGLLGMYASGALQAKPEDKG